MLQDRPAENYTAPAIGLHWLIAGLVALGVGIGLVMTGLSMSPLRLKLYNWHKWTGIVVLSLSVVRVFWRASHRAPVLPAMPAWQRAAAHATHASLYLLLLAVPLAGWTYSSAAGFPVVLFGILPLPDLVAPDKALAGALKIVHKALAYTVVALAAVHVGAVLKHQFLDRDGLLFRMLPRYSGRGAS